MNESGQAATADPALASAGAARLHVRFADMSLRRNGAAARLVVPVRWWRPLEGEAPKALQGWS